MEERDDGDVALGYPLIDDGGGRKRPPVVGYPLPLEKKEPRPSSTSATRPPPHDNCASCKMFTQGFVIALMLVLATDLVLGTFSQRHPHPLLVLICLPFFPVVCGGILLLILCCEASKLDSQVG